jgi:hypothetical protein
LVTTVSGATTQPDPSRTSPQAIPTILTVDGAARATAARIVGSDGVGSGDAAGGSNCAKTFGNPAGSSIREMREKISGAGGITRSIARRIADRWSGDVRLGSGTVESIDAMSQVAMSIAAPPMTAPAP